MANTSNATKKDEGRTSSGYSGSEFRNKAENTAEGLMEKGKDMASHLGEKAKDTATAAMRTAGDAVSAVGHKAEDAVSGAGGGLRSLAGTIRENAPREGMIGSAASTVASGLESGGRYLQEEGISGMADDVTHMIRRNPIPAVLIGIGVGFLLARITSSRS